MRLGRTAEMATAGVIALGGISAMVIMPGYAESRWASSRHMIHDQIRAEGDVRPLSPEAARVACGGGASGRTGPTRRALKRVLRRRGRG